jgi:hypothetical protein
MRRVKWNPSKNNHKRNKISIHNNKSNTNNNLIHSNPHNPHHIKKNHNNPQKNHHKTPTINPYLHTHSIITTPKTNPASKNRDTPYWESETSSKTKNNTQKKNNKIINKLKNIDLYVPVTVIHLVNPPDRTSTSSPLETTQNNSNNNSKYLPIHKRL